MKKVGGFFLIVLGILLLCWVGYNLFIERLPETKERSPIPAIIFAVCLLAVGGSWLRSKKESQE